LLDVIAKHDLVQHLQSAVHRCGHSLGLVRTRPDFAVSVPPIEPPLQSNLSFMVVILGCHPPSHSASFIKICRRRTFNVDTFARDLHQLDLIITYPVMSKRPSHITIRLTDCGLISTHQSSANLFDIMRLLGGLTTFVVKLSVLHAA
jgi:hypothetical protein